MTATPEPRYRVVNTGSCLAIRDRTDPSRHVRNFRIKQRAAAREYADALNADEPTDLITLIDPEILADSCDDAFRGEFAAADETTQRAVVGYLNTYAGPWGIKASEEDAVLGIIAALWPEWAEGERSSGIDKFRSDERLGLVADALGEDCGETPVVHLVARIVAMLRPITEGA